MKQGFSMPQRLFLCLLSAALVWVSFPNFLCKSLTPPTAFLGWVALVPFFLALRQVTWRQGILLGLVFGFAQFGGILYWIAFLEAAHYLSGLAWALLVFYLALYLAVFGGGFRYLETRLGGGIWIAPFLWVALEYIRGSRPWGGFSWGEIGYSQAPYPSLLILTSCCGVYGLTFLMVWFNAWMARWIGNILDSKNEGENRVSFRWASLLFPFGILGALLVWGNVEIDKTPLRQAGTVALLQPSIDEEMKWSKQNEAATYKKLGRLVQGLKDSRPDLIIWPETAAPSYLLWTPQDLSQVLSIIRDSKTAHLVGCLDAQKKINGKICYFNAAIHFSPEGKVEGIYQKRHLVPFGEFVPFQKYISFLGPVVGDLGNFDTGDSYKRFETGKFSYTPMICYEVIFPGDVYQAFRTQADALVNISNDAWYGRTASAYQHAMMAVVRAAEERKPLLRAANTGICLVTDPFGRILCSSRLFEETSLTGKVLLAVSDSPTLYSIWGNWFPRFCWGMVALMGFMAIVKTWKHLRGGN